MPDGFLEMSWYDFDGDLQSVTVEGLPIALDGTDLPAFDAAASAFDTALNAVLAGRQRVTRYTVEVVDNGLGSAASPIAQHSLQMICEYEDIGVGQNYRLRFPAPDMTVSPAWVKSGGLTELDLTSTLGAAFKTSFDAFVQRNGNSAILRKVWIED